MPSHHAVRDDPASALSSKLAFGSWSMNSWRSLSTRWPIPVSDSLSAALLIRVNRGLSDLL